MDKQLLIEYLPFKISPQVLNEGLKKSGNLVVEGIIQRANAKNQNGRIYPKNVLEREFEKYIKGPVTERRAIGELDHPESAVINLKNGSHIFTKIWWDNDDVWGRMEVLTTPSGNILKEYLINNITVGVSSRGMGSVKQLGENTVEVQDDFELLCIDVVSTPSTHGSFMRKTINESKEYNPKLISKYSKVNKIITEIICNRTNYCPCDFDIK